MLDPGTPLVCGVRSTGALACWGTVYVQPWSIPAGRFTSIAVSSDSQGFQWACARTVAATIRCWGDGEYAQTLPPPKNVFDRLSAGSDLSLGGCVISTDQRLGCWGGDSVCHFTSCDVAGPEDLRYRRFTDVSSLPDGSGACAVAGNQSLACWGGASFSGVGRFTQVSLGSGRDRDACAIMISGHAMCWQDIGASSEPADIPRPPK